MNVLERPWCDFDERRHKIDLVIIPAGAVEVYGLHLPLGTDTIVATHIAQRVGEALGAPVLPTLPVGFSRMIADVPGTLNISPATIAAYMRETAESAITWGFKRFLFINSHRGNISPIDEVAFDLQARYGVRCAQVFWWDFLSPLVKDLCETGASANGHAAEIATSIMLYLEPDLVVRERIKDYTPTHTVPYADINQYKGMRWRMETGCGGNPKKATAEKGAEMVRRGVDRIVAFVLEQFASEVRKEAQHSLSVAAPEGSVNLESNGRLT